MSRSSARRRVAAVPAMVVVPVLLLAGCAGGEPEEPVASPTPSILGDLDTAGLEVPRLDFCGLVPDDLVEQALGTAPERGDARAPGDPAVEGGDGSVQEVGCSWSAGTGNAAVTARAWVFARPVGEPLAERVVADAGEREGCRASRAAYGDPGVRQDCGRGPGLRVRYAGLLGDTWLTCELQGSGARSRAEAWCTGLLASLDPEASPAPRPS